jgi:large subunit ribosomal protein L30
MSQKMLKITLIRGFTRRPEKQRKVTRGLGLRRIRQTVVREDKPEIRGMIAKIPHMVIVEEFIPVKEDNSKNA